MPKNNIKKFLKIFFVTLVIISTLNIGLIVTQADNNANNNEEKVQTISTNIEISNIAKTGVAISVNLGLRLGDTNKISEITIKRIFSIKESLENKELIKQELIADNMTFLKEYYSVLKTDFRKIIEDSNDKEVSLDSITEELKLRYNLGVKQVANLEKQRTIYLTEMETISSSLEGIITDINSNFKITNTNEIKTNIDDYLEEKNNYYYFRTLVVFENKFINYYNTLNSYNKELIDNFILNKDIITKGSYLVIPDNGNEILQEYGLLYTEEEYLNQTEEEITD